LAGDQLETLAGGTVSDDEGDIDDNDDKEDSP
jgi:hypothetical protein